MQKFIPPLICLTAVAAGCSHENPTVSTSASSMAPPVVDGTPYLLSEEPVGATGVIRAREESQDGDDVVLVGRIGGSANPWIEGRAAFSIVDGSLRACSDIPGDECPKPWDYCCETDKLPRATVLIKVVDGSGNVVKAEAKALLDVSELSTVVVKGQAKRDDAGNLTVLATGVHVKRD